MKGRKEGKEERKGRKGKEKARRVAAAHTAELPFDPNLYLAELEIERSESPPLILQPFEPSFQFLPTVGRPLAQLFRFLITQLKQLFEERFRVKTSTLVLSGGEQRDQSDFVV